MSRTEPVNVAASVRDRLLHRARGEGKEFQSVLQDFACERWLFRLQVSPHAGSLVLKGAALFRVWSSTPHRATRDCDFLKYGDTSPDAIAQLVRAVATIEPAVPDGLIFDDTSLRVDEIREANAYHGVRARFVMHLDQARIPMQMDFGFGDVIVPDPVEVEYPTLLDMPAPKIQAYPQETVVAEKFQAMASLGERNTRMKDFYDVWYLAANYPFEGSVLAEAITATFAQRRTRVPGDVPLVLSDEHAASPTVAGRWQGFANRGLFESHRDLPFGDVAAMCRNFVVPVAQRLHRKESFEASWHPGGPWKENDGTD